MNYVNYSSNNKDEKAEVIFTSSLNHMISEVLLMRTQHLAKLNRERVRQCEERK
jgi:hypothetical protein